MKHNAYDFDKTIYLGDSTVDFFFYCLKRYPLIILTIPNTLFFYVLYVLGICTKTRFKENMFKFLKHVSFIDQEIENFWGIKRNKIASFYIKNKKNEDIIISASPEFLLRPICALLEVENLIASRVNKKTGEYTGDNCFGQEKVSRLILHFPDAKIQAFYSDSLSDAPMASLAQQAFLVKKGNIYNWPNK